MTTPDLTLDDLPTAADGTAPEPVPAEEDPHRRRKLLLLLLLSLLTALLAGFAFWYLLYRKPISELPIPAIQAAMPAYQFAAYNVDHPLGIAVSADGSRIYVTQNGGAARDALILDSHGTKLGALTPPAGVVSSATQRYVAVNPANGEVWTSDRTAGLVYVYAADGTFKRVFNSGEQYVGWQPLAIGFDGKGDVYITDVGGAVQLIHEFKTDGTLVRDFGADDRLSFPNGVAADTAGNVYVADSNNGRLLIYAPSGARIGTVERGSATDQLGMPRGLAVDDRNQVYVVDTSAQHVQVYRTLATGEASPKYLDAFGTEGTVDGTFEFPNGIAVDGRGRLYVADWNNDRVQVWSY